MIVVDASAAVNALVYGADRGSRGRARLAADPAWVVPEHWTVEIFSAVRRNVAAGLLADAVGAAVLQGLRGATFETVPTVQLLGAMWEMRANVSAYDAPYVAIAAQYDLTLVTADQRMARAAIGQCRVELV